LNFSTKEKEELSQIDDYYDYVYDYYYHALIFSTLLKLFTTITNFKLNKNTQ